MEPIPLTSPDGITYAYACSHCHHVAAAGTIGRDYTAVEIAECARFSRDQAEWCCKCYRCGGSTVTPDFNDDRPYSMCASCWESGGREAEIERVAAWQAKEAVDFAAREASLDKALDRDAAIALEEAMSWISERDYCAGWLTGLGATLWNALQNGPTRFGMGDITAEDIARLRALSEKAGGWWRYDEFVPIAEWTANPIDT